MAVSHNAPPATAAAIFVEAADKPNLWKKLKNCFRRGGSKDVREGVSTIGHYPDYTEAAKLGAKHFEVPPGVWEKMSPAEQWAANQKFLDRAIARGDRFFLATPLNQMRPNSAYAREVDHLLKNGYKPSPDGRSLNK